MEGDKAWLSSLAADFFDTSIQKQVPHFQRWLPWEVA
jgi:hypothetical protein